MSANICLIGQSGPVSERLQAELGRDAQVRLSVLSAQQALTQDDLREVSTVTEADLVILCVQDFASPQLLARLPEHCRVLDISPAFRTAPDWVYGLAELPGQDARIRAAQRVANPGCFATAALLLTAPLHRAGLLQHLPLLYLDAIGGYTTGGQAMVDTAQAGHLPAEAVYTLQKEHRHVPEIRTHSGFPGALWFSPKVGAYARGIRLQLPLPGLARETVLATLRAAYVGTSVLVSDNSPFKLAAHAWADKPGACLYVVPEQQGCLALCVLDNLGKGAAEAALQNVRLMLELPPAAM